MTTKKTGLDALLTPEESVLLLIDHQPFQFANLHSHEPTMSINNVISVAKTAKVSRPRRVLARNCYLCARTEVSRRRRRRPLADMLFRSDHAV